MPKAWRGEANWGEDRRQVYSKVVTNGRAGTGQDTLTHAEDWVS